MSFSLEKDRKTSQGKVSVITPQMSRKGTDNTQLSISLSGDPPHTTVSAFYQGILTGTQGQCAVWSKSP